MYMNITFIYLFSLVRSDLSFVSLSPDSTECTKSQNGIYTQFVIEISGPQFSTNANVNANSNPQWKQIFI